MTPAKLLLLGEHTVLHGGDALAVPLPQFGARWSVSAPTESQPFPRWAAYAKTAVTPAEGQAPMATWLDVDRFAAEASVLTVDSTIPRDYGLGSSGALTALVYARYRREPADPPLPQLRRRLGQLESFFHGRSSGLDPLVCYRRTGVHVRADGAVATLAPPRLATERGRWFLLDARQPKAGHAAIARFRASAQEAGFRQNFLRPARTLTAELIAELSSGPQEPGEGWVRGLRQLSALQLAYLPWLIPEAVAAAWRRLLDADAAYVKLCGAGGGGYFLGWAPAGGELGGLGVTWLGEEAPG